jgi:hypothetical protein
MSEVFISYSRKNGDFVRRLQEALEARDRDAWVDWEDIPATASWRQEISDAIEAADTFVFVISPDSVASEVCGQEVAHAAEHHKRLVPLICREVESQAVPESLADLQWIFFREQDDFEASVQTLINALDTDLDWVKAHTRLLTRALEWDRKASDKSLLLRGADLKNAEEWLALSSDKEPKPTDLQGQYILASRQGERKRQRFTLSAVTAGLVIALALAVIAFIQYRQSEERGRVALSRQLADQADKFIYSQPDLALLLSVEAVKVKPTVQARGALLEALQRSPLFSHFLQAHKGGVNSVAFSPDGQTLASGSGDKTIILWDLARRQPQGPPLTGHQTDVSSVVFSPDGKTLASGGLDRNIILWDVANGKPRGQPLKGHKYMVLRVAFSPDGKTLASVSNDGTIILWDLARRQPLGPPLTGHQTDVSSVAFSPDGKTLAPGGFKTIRLWDVEARQPLGAPLIVHQNTVNSLAFSPDGRTLASGSGDKTITLREVAVKSWLKRACYVANRNLTKEEWHRYMGDDVPYRKTCPDLPGPED